MLEILGRLRKIENTLNIAYPKPEDFMEEDKLWNLKRGFK